MGPLSAAALTEPIARPARLCTQMPAKARTAPELLQEEAKVFERLVALLECPSERLRVMSSARLLSGLKALSRLTNWETAASRRAQMQPTPDACRDLSELLGHPQRCVLSPLV